MQTPEQVNAAPPTLASAEANPASEVTSTPVDTEATGDLPPAALPPVRNAEQTAEVFEATADWKDENETVMLSGGTTDDITEQLSKLPNLQVEKTPEGREWVSGMRASIYSMPFKGWFTRTALNPDAYYRQGVKNERGQLITAAKPSFHDKDGTGLKGEAAMLRVRSLMGMGSVIQAPLWHSGFWISFKAPADAEILELSRRLAEEKVTLGRQTFGLAFANNSVFFNSYLLEFALRNVYDCSLKDSSQIRSMISSLDIPHICWAIACCIWPQGFQYARSVLDPDGVKYTIMREKVNVGKLQWTDNQSLTAWQIAHMGKRASQSMTPEEVQRYRSEFTKGKGRDVPLNEHISLRLRVPSMQQYVNNGQKWVNDIVTMVDRAFGMEGDAEDRDTYIMEQGKATNMRQFSHWVESIDAAGQLISDEETIAMTFDTLSSDDASRKKFFEEVRLFMEDSTVSLIAVVAANEKEKSGMPRFPNLLPLDVQSTFFILLEQKVQRIRDR